MVYSVENKMSIHEILFVETLSFSEYMMKQIEEINLYKWIMSERAGYDLGQSCISEWINLYAKEYRNNGKCRKY